MCAKKFIRLNYEFLLTFKASIIIFVKIIDINQTLKLIRMTLIKSISGIRGTIGGKVGDNLQLMQ
jgi:hypothetical protein